jgi:hypothetical protein
MKCSSANGSCADTFHISRGLSGYFHRTLEGLPVPAQEAVHFMDDVIHARSPDLSRDQPLSKPRILQTPVFIRIE